MTYTPDQIISEMRWERRMMGLGQAEHDRREEHAKANNQFHNSRTGQTILNDLLPDFEKGIARLRQSVIRMAIDREHKAALLMLPAGTLALITLRVIFGSPEVIEPDFVSRGVPSLALSRRIGQGVKDEILFREWLAASEGEAKAYAEREGLLEAPTSLAERLLREAGVGQRQIRRWVHAFAQGRVGGFNADTYLFVGGALLDRLVDTFPDYFELALVPDRGETHKRFRRTEAFEEELARVSNNHRLAATLLLPMIVPPQPWVADTKH